MRRLDSIIANGFCRIDTAIDIVIMRHEHKIESETIEKNKQIIRMASIVGGLLGYPGVTERDMRNQQSQNFFRSMLMAVDAAACSNAELQRRAGIGAGL